LYIAVEIEEIQQPELFKKHCRLRLKQNEYFMKKIVFLFTAFVFLFFSKINAQNLVPNPSFEEYYLCPDDNSMIHYSQGWLVYGGTPDYFNTCSTISWFEIPSNRFGNQTPNSGNSYAGFGTFTSLDINSREFFGVELIDSLLIGQKYYFSFYVSLSDYSNCISNNIGLRFTSYYNYLPDPNNYSHFNIDTMIVDSAKWVKIAGSFIADSTYKYIEFGIFYDGNSTDTVIIGAISTIFSYDPSYASYYYIDDICVSQDSLTCNLSTDIIDYEIMDKIQIFPNPVNNILYIENKFPEKEIEKIIIYNSQGIIEDMFCDFKENFINLENYRNGIYYICIYSTNLIITRKFIIN
jgi:hypothetical protein